MSIDEMNSEYGITGQLTFVTGEGGLPFIEIDNGKARAVISVYAGQLLSYQPAGEAEDLMFLSGQAYYQEGKAIKGGVPICWPWFGADPEGKGRPAHGFVRNRMWDVRTTEATADGDTRVTLGLVDNDETREIWPQAFDLSLEITVGETLGLALITRNTGDLAYAITQAMHTYFRVGDIDQVKVLGLEDTDYLDKVDAGRQKTQHGPITIAEEVDRIYYCGSNAELAIADAALGRRIRISSSGSKTAVVWNPWEKIAAEMADLADDDYRRFICVETTNAAADVVKIEPGAEARLCATYQAVRT